MDSKEHGIDCEIRNLETEFHQSLVYLPMPYCWTMKASWLKNQRRGYALWYLMQYLHNDINKANAYSHERALPLWLALFPSSFDEMLVLTVRSPIFLLHFFLQP